MVMVNLPTAGVDFHVPFGGRKGSSYGSREQGKYAAEFYTIGEDRLHAGLNTIAPRHCIVCHGRCVIAAPVFVGSVASAGRFIPRLGC